ncbi:hypothetical protein KIN20_033478, partial [Parelaphostrongylus tenuis]
LNDFEKRMITNGRYVFDGMLAYLEDMRRLQMWWERTRHHLGRNKKHETASKRTITLTKLLNVRISAMQSFLFGTPMRVLMPT